MNLREWSGINRVIKGIVHEPEGAFRYNRVITGIVHGPEGVFRYK